MRGVDAKGGIPSEQEIDFGWRQLGWSAPKYFDLMLEKRNTVSRSIEEADLEG